MNKMFLFAVAFGMALTCRGQQTIVEIGETTGAVINRNIYGQFAEHLGRCIYDGIYRNGEIRMDIVEALRRIRVPLLRWPGGCFADNYHWKDGIGPANERVKGINIMWGMVSEDNSFGTHEFLELCGLIGCEPYIAGNVGTGSPEELESWVEYCNYAGESTMSLLRAKNGHQAPYRVRFWGIGNESWGCGGRMTPETYTAKYRTFANYVREYPGSPVSRIASGALDDDYQWTEYLMSHISPRWLQGVGVHYYAQVEGDRGMASSMSFTEAQYFGSLKNALRMDSIISRHAAIMDKYDPGKRVALIVDEWGIAIARPEAPEFFYQQNSLRDALVAATTLNIFNNHCDRVRMANLAQAVNVLQSLILTSADSMVLTPTYFVFDLYKVHQDAKWLAVQLKGVPSYANGRDSIPAINASASVDSNGMTHVSLVNLDPERTVPIQLDLGVKKWSAVHGQVLTSDKVADVNTFTNPDKISNRVFSNFKRKDGGFLVDMPPKSVVMLQLK